MVRAWGVFKVCKGNSLLMLCLLACMAAVHFTIRFIEVNNYKQRNCTYDESIDIVYTWVNGSDPRFIAEINKYLKFKAKKDSIDSSKQRYEDKNELRFSLRSLEKYAPWINHVFLVTNGQIPYWLNLDYEKITVVTHDVIFRDKYNLPTFSSPAIESNLHRIPGLSKRFIYFNDDIFIGQPLYLDDFYAATKGYMVFLAYTLPSCASNCPWLYVGDGQCDLNCNTERCQFDGGDCSEKHLVQAAYVDEVNSRDTTESYNDKVNRELEILEQKVQDLLKYSRIRSDLNASRIQTNDNNRTKEAANKMRNKTENRQVDRYMPKIVNMSIPDLVEEHNRKVLVRNKRMSRRKKSFLKEGRSNNAFRRFLRSATKNIDGFLESLLYTQRLLNKKYGYRPRYVPAHAPIFLEKDIMQGLENTFLSEFELTERNRFRHDDDVQFGFSYYYFLMSETIERSVSSIFNEFDTDDSGTWSDREIRNLLTQIYELPLTYEIVDRFEGILLNCSELKRYPDVDTPPYERYIDSRLPTISKDMITQCPFLSQFLKSKFGQIPRYKYQVIKEAENSFATFRMLVSNITSVVIKLDEIRSRMTKFVCLNDNLDESKPNENDLIKAILYDFYMSLFPHPSKFELPEHSRNRFLHMTELLEWKQRHFVLRLVLCAAILSLIFITFFNVFRKGCCKIFGDLFC